MRVVILGRTKMGQGVCVGGMVEDTGRPVRLLPRGTYCHPPHTPFQVGQVWDLDLRPRNSIEPPHTEDHDEWNGRLVGHHDDLLPFLRRWVKKPWMGGPETLFDGTLRVRKSGTAYLPRHGPQPVRSVGFWVLPAALIFLPREGDRRFLLQHTRPIFKIPYVGTAPPPTHIPKGTLVRVSLARWWLNPNHADEGETCALQLSGWYPRPTAS